MRRALLCLLLGSVLVFGPHFVGAHPALAESGGKTLRVCADPNNLPFSDHEGAGFENKLAEWAAHRLGRKLDYVWWAQRRGFVRNTLSAGDCDVIMGVPIGFDLVAHTRPYYRSKYVFVTRRDRRLDIESLKDPRLRHLSIGINLIGDDGFNTPPAHALGALGLTGNVHGYSIYGDYRQRAPPGDLIDAVERGNIDVAVAWGPVAGYAARAAKAPLTVTPVSDDDFRGLRFQFDIGMGVRKGDAALRDRLDEFITANRPEIDALLISFGVPIVPLESTIVRAP